MLFHIWCINFIWSLTVIGRNYAKSFVCFLCENNILINIISDFANSLKEVWLGHVFATVGTTLNDVSVLGHILAFSNKINQFCMSEHYFGFILENTVSWGILCFILKNEKIHIIDVSWYYLKFHKRQPIGK